MHFLDNICFFDSPVIQAINIQVTIIKYRVIKWWTKSDAFKVFSRNEPQDQK